FFFQAEDGIRDYKVTGVQTCALPISAPVESCNSSVVSGNTFVNPNCARLGPSARITSCFELLPVIWNPAIRMLSPLPTGSRVEKIGRASCRERVEVLEGGGAVRKKEE